MLLCVGACVHVCVRMYGGLIVHALRPNREPQCNTAEYYSATHSRVTQYNTQQSNTVQHTAE